MRYQAWILLILASLYSCSMRNDVEEIKPSDNLVNVGDALPAFVVEMNDGTRLRSEDLKGKPSLVLLFSTTCPDCQRELPGLNKRYLEHGADTTFVAISREQASADVSAYWEKEGLSLPYSAQPDRYVYSLFAKKGIPRIYISDLHGIVQRVETPF